MVRFRIGTQAILPSHYAKPEQLDLSADLAFISKEQLTPSKHLPDFRNPAGVKLQGARCRTACLGSPRWVPRLDLDGIAAF